MLEGQASSSREAPTMAVSPEIETKMPNKSPAAASEAVSLACCVHVVPLLTNTYAEPEKAPASPSKIAPAMAVFPEIETEPPN